MINGNANLTFIRRGFIPSKSGSTFYWTGQYNGTDLVNAVGTNVPLVSGTGLDAIYDFSVLNDDRFDKGATVGNALGLPEYYNNPLNAYFYYDGTSQTTRRYWKLKDFHYFYVQQQTDITPQLLNNWAFLKAKATTDTSNEITSVDSLYIYSTEQTDSALTRLQNHIGIWINMALFDGSTSYCELTSPITIDRTKNTTLEIKYRRYDKTRNLESILGDQLTDAYRFLLFTDVGTILYETNTNNDNATGVLNDDDNLYHELSVNINNSIVSMTQDSSSMVMSDNTITDDFTFNRFGKSNLLRFFYGNIRSLSIIENGTTIINIPDLTTGLDISENNNNATCYNVSLTPYYRS